MLDKFRKKLLGLKEVYKRRGGGDSWGGMCSFRGATKGSILGPYRVGKGTSEGEAIISWKKPLIKNRVSKSTPSEGGPD